MKNKTFIVVGIIVLGLVLGFFALNSYIYNEKQASAFDNYKDAEYILEGQLVKLENGFSEIDSEADSTSKMVTQYFGNEFITDLDNDGRDDVVFLLAQQTGGSGTFYYVVAALNTDKGYMGTDGFLLGDRIAPQTIELSPNPRHKNVIVVNYSDRAIGEPMTAEPSLGKSSYLKLDPQSMMWGIVEPDFEGESR